MRAIERIKARHALRRQGATGTEAVQAIAELERAGKDAELADLAGVKFVAAKTDMSAEKVVETVKEAAPEVVEEDEGPAPVVTDGDVVVAGEVAEEPPVAEDTPVTKMSAEELREFTKDELYDLATDLEIDGRSTMNKDELVEAIQAAE